MSLEELGDPRLVFGATRKIVSAYLENDFWGAITYGGPGSGKTRLKIKQLAQIYGEWSDGRDKNGNRFSYVPLDQMNWRAWKDWMRHTIEDFLEMIDHAHNKGRQQMYGVLDDAGIAAANYKWQQHLGQALNDYANVQRRDFACLDFTTPDPRWLLGHVRNMPGGHSIKVVRTTGNPYQRHIRCANVYEGWMSPDFKKSGVSLLWHDWFDTRLPQFVEEEFDPINRKYAELAIERIREAYYEMKGKAKNPRQEKKAEMWLEEQEKKTGFEIPTDKT